MARRGGFPGGGMPGNMANLMKQAQKMQKQMEDATKELEEKEMTASAGGGVVEVKRCARSMSIRRIRWVRLPAGLAAVWGCFSNGVLQCPDQQINRVIGRLAWDRDQVGAAHGVPYFGYAGGRSRKAVKFHYRGKAQGLLL